MVKPKKRASKRVGTAQREKIKRKISQHHKKSRKDAKKDVTWKSKLKKDPGIPNSYPFKEQLLNEIERKREREEEEKRKLKEEKKSKKKNGNAQNDDDDEMDADAQDDDADIATGMNQDLEEEEVPQVVMYQESLQELIKDQDIHTLIQVVDARDPILSNVPKLIQQAKENGKNLLVALTRCDLLPLEALLSLLSYLSLSSNLPITSFFPLILSQAPPTTHVKAYQEYQVASANFPGVEALAHKVNELSSSRLEKLQKEKSIKGKGKKNVEEDDEDDDVEVGAVGIVGIENSGRTSVATCLSSALTLLNTSTSTSSEASLEDLLIFDTPCIISPTKSTLPSEDQDSESSEDDEPSKLKIESEALRVLMRNQGSLNKIKDPLPLVSMILNRLINPTDLMLIYNTPAFGSFSTSSTPVVGDDEEEIVRKRNLRRSENESNLKEFLIGLARNRGKIAKKGIPDWWGSSRVLLRDWSVGEIGYYSNVTISNFKDLDLKVSGEEFKEKFQAAKEIVMGNSTLKDELKERKEWRKTEIGKKELRLKVVDGKSLEEIRPNSSKVEGDQEIYFRKLRGDEKLEGDDEDGWEESEVTMGGIEDEDEDQDEGLDDELEVDEEDEEEDEDPEIEEQDTSKLKSILKPSKTSKKSDSKKGSAPQQVIEKSKKSVRLGGAETQAQAKAKKNEIVKVSEGSSLGFDEAKPVSKKEKRKAVASVPEVQEQISKKAKNDTAKKVKKSVSEVKTKKVEPQGPAPGEKYDFGQFF